MKDPIILKKKFFFNLLLSKLKKEKVYNLTNVILLKEGNEKFIEYVHKSIK